MNNCNLLRYGLASLFMIGGILGFIWVYMYTLSVCDKNKKRVRLYKKVMDLIELGICRITRHCYYSVYYPISNNIHMTHEEEIEKAAQHYCDELECDGREIDYEDTQWAFQDGAQYEDEFILKMVDEHVDRMIKDIPTPSYDYEEGLRKAFISMRNWLHVKLGK